MSARGGSGGCGVAGVSVTSDGTIGASSRNGAGGGGVVVGAGGASGTAVKYRTRAAIQSRAVFTAVCVPTYPNS